MVVEYLRLFIYLVSNFKDDFCRVKIMISLGNIYLIHTEKKKKTDRIHKHNKKINFFLLGNKINMREFFVSLFL